MTLAGVTLSSETRGHAIAHVPQCPEMSCNVLPMSSAAATATAKREVREALRFAGFPVTAVLANKTYVQVTLVNESDVLAVLRMYPDAIRDGAESKSSYYRRTIRIPR